MHFFGVNEFREVFRGGWTVVAVVARGHNQDQNWILGGDFRFDPADGSEGSRPTCVAHGCLNIGFRNATTFALDTYTHAVETPVPAVPGRGCATTAECEANRQYFVVLARFDPTVGYSVSVLDRAGVESHASDGVTTGLPTGFGFANLRIFRGSQIASTASDFGQGGFGELLIYDTALSDADVGTIGTYLRAEWGL